MIGLTYIVSIFGFIYLYTYLVGVTYRYYLKKSDHFPPPETRDFRHEGTHGFWKSTEHPEYRCEDCYNATAAGILFPFYFLYIGLLHPLVMSVIVKPITALFKAGSQKENP